MCLISCTHKTLKQALTHGLVLKKVHRVIKFNQEIWLKPYIDMNTELVKMQKMVLNYFFQLHKQCIF